jgi:AcrR family transcriptional regulator
VGAPGAGWTLSRGDDVLDARWGQDCLPRDSLSWTRASLRASKVQRRVASSATTGPRYRVAEDSILDAAVAVFAREGHGRASMDAIAADAGITKPTLYARFGSKEGLFTAAAAREMRIRRDRLFLVYDMPPSEPFRQRLRRWNDEFFSLAAERPDGFRLVAEAERHPAAADLLVRAHDEITTRIAGIVLGVSRRRSRHGARLVASMITGMLTACADEALTLGADLEAAAALCESFLYAALRGLDASLIDAVN